ncbi:MAG: NAD-dependent deacylase [Lutibacter sp.]|uniref:SIR2 family NAD-dependent protein deacylase n=1 Tax=Lutibacter sp. TaxID=1925666 RepID=UPI00183B22FF|nr:Sir2 family NAD-dependent protein deacetylase [Lutibacter sp.]MBT8317215.1 NAD-dependent deacylase [Lutibacter sp.]NNJ58074.1 NAD-dependent deacylase [Lutibacter sp.]
MKKIVVLTGAGMSAESGLKTFRDANGLWEGHDIMEVASPIGWEKDKNLVLDFYNKRRTQLLQVSPNTGHKALVELEQYFDVTIVTQNVDDLHERAGSKHILHLHGELLKVRSTKNEQLIYDWKKDLIVGDFCEENHQLRPHIVWYGEEVPMLDKAIKYTATADILIIIGTSMQVYPAASLVHFVKPKTPIYFIDPNPSIAPNQYNNLRIIPEKASTGVLKIVKELIY